MRCVLAQLQCQWDDLVLFPQAHLHSHDMTCGTHCVQMGWMGWGKKGFYIIISHFDHDRMIPNVS